MYTTKKLADLRPTCDGYRDRTLEELVRERPDDPEKNLDEKVATLVYKCRKVLDACYTREFSASCMNELIESVPGILVLLGDNTVDSVAAIVGVDVEIVRNLV